MATPSLKAKLQLLPSQSSSGPIRPWHRPLSTGAGRPRTPAPSGALSLRPPFTKGAREQAPWTVTSSLLPTARKGEALGWLPQRKGMFLLSGNVLQEELASRMRMSPAAPQWHPPPEVQPFLLCPPLLRSHSPSHGRGAGILALGSSCRPGPTPPYIHGTRVPGTGLSTFPKAPTGCAAQPAPRKRLVQVDSATTPGLHTRPPAGTADTSPGPEKRRAAHPQLAGAEGTGTAKLVATQALRGAKSGDRPRPRAGLGGAGSAPPRGLGLFRAPLPTPLFSLLLLANPGGCRCSLLAALSLGWPHPKCSSDISSLCGHLLKRLQSLATPS